MEKNETFSKIHFGSLLLRLGNYDLKNFPGRDFLKSCIKKTTLSSVVNPSSLRVTLEQGGNVKGMKAKGWKYM